MNLFITLAFSALMAALYSGYVKGDNPDLYAADIEIEKLESGTVFNGLFMNKSTEEVRFVYRLSMQRKGKSGISSTSQGGYFTAEPGEKVCLRRIQMNVGDEDEYAVSLEIYYGQQLVAEKVIRRLTKV